MISLSNISSSNRSFPGLTVFTLTVFTLVALALCLGLTLQPQVRHLINPGQLPATLEQLGPWGPLFYIVIITLSVVVSQIPGAPLAVAAGAVWDPLMAGLYTVIGGFSGALIAYGLGKHLGPSILKALIGKTLSFGSDGRRPAQRAIAAPPT